MLFRGFVIQGDMHLLYSVPSKMKNYVSKIRYLVEENWLYVTLILIVAFGLYEAI